MGIFASFPAAASYCWQRCFSSRTGRRSPSAYRAVLDVPPALEIRLPTADRRPLRSRLESSMAYSCSKRFLSRVLSDSGSVLQTTTLAACATPPAPFRPDLARSGCVDHVASCLPCKWRPQRRCPLSLFDLSISDWPRQSGAETYRTVLTGAPFLDPSFGPRAGARDPEKLQQPLARQANSSMAVLASQKSLVQVPCRYTSSSKEFAASLASHLHSGIPYSSYSSAIASRSFSWLQRPRSCSARPPWFGCRHSRLLSGQLGRSVR